MTLTHRVIFVVFINYLLSNKGKSEVKTESEEDKVSKPTNQTDTFKYISKMKQ